MNPYPQNLNNPPYNNEPNPYSNAYNNPGYNNNAGDNPYKNAVANIPAEYQQQQHYMYGQNDPFYNPYFNIQGETYQDDRNSNQPKPQPFIQPENQINQNPYPLNPQNNILNDNALKDHDINMNHDKYMVFFQYDSVNVFAFDFQELKYSKCPNFYNFKMLSYFRVAQTPEFTFVLTGGSQSDQSFSNGTYHYVDGYFYKQNDMHKERRAHCSVYHDGYVYVFGGLGFNGQLRHCERFKVAENRWEDIAPLAQERSLGSCCVFGKEKIYVIGGYNENMRQDLIDIECYDVRTNAFNRALCKSPLKIENPFVVQINECEIAIMGGFFYETNRESGDIYVVNVFNGKNDFRGKMQKACWSAYCHPYLVRSNAFLLFHTGGDEFYPGFIEVSIN